MNSALLYFLKAESPVISILQDFLLTVNVKHVILLIKQLKGLKMKKEIKAKYNKSE